jgi:hypothetical protein
MQEIVYHKWRMKQAHTFVASLVKVEYFWIACWIVSSSVTLRSVRRTILGMLAAVLGVW